MSLRKISAGNGYEYLLRSVVRNDEDQKPIKLADYYAAKGTPPGRWIGAGVAGFGGHIREGDVIRDDQMAALFGEGLHPDADLMIENGATFEDLKIGRPFAIYTGSDPVLEAVHRAEMAVRRDLHRLPTKQERNDLAAQIASPMFVDINGSAPQSQREVLNWINQRQQKVRQAVAGYDLTFSPQKSVSVLWALADETTASKIAELHHRAVAQTLEWANDHVVFTRRGARGIEQIKTRGLIAAEFTHFDTRSGDPDLHSHVVVSNKVQGEDGKWRSLDGQALFQHHHVLDFRYTATLTDLLQREMGLSFHANERGEAKEPVYELDGVPDDLNVLFTKRQQLAKPVYERFVAEYVEQFGYAPSYQVVRGLWQKAILETRNAKQPAKALNDLRAEWQLEVCSSLPHGDALLEAVRGVYGRGGDDSRPVYDPAVHDCVIAQAALATVTRRRATFQRSHVLTAVLGKLNGYRFDDPEALGDASERITDQILCDTGVPLDAEDAQLLPAALRRADGKAIDYRANQERFTTQAILDAEHLALEAVTTPVAVYVPNRMIEDALAAHERAHGWALNAQQAELVYHLANAGTLSATGVGAAGTGKTASMQVLAMVWHERGNAVHALAPSAAAAAVLGDDIGVEGRTIDSLTRAWRAHHSVENLPVHINRGDMLLVDEAGMSSTENLATLTEIAQATGAVLRLIGDHKQLDAVETGGLFGAMTAVASTVQLTDVQRFGDDLEQANASLRLRDGDPTALDIYERRQWIHSGARQHVLDDAVADFLNDERLGRKSLIIAATNADVDQLNAAVQADRIARGVVHLGHVVTLSRGEQAGIGDTIITRRNTRFTPEGGVPQRVTNGDLLTINAIGEDGGIVATDRATGERKVLPAHYVASHVHLGYASTVYRAQGATVDVCRAVIDDSVNRAGFYVAMTRGKYANHAYVVTETPLDETAEDAHYFHKGDATAPTAREVLSRCINRDDRQRSATEQLLATQAQDPQVLAERWLAGRDIAIDHFIDAHLPGYLDSLPHHWSRDLEDADGGDAPIRQTWRELVRHGVDPRTVMDGAIRHCDGCEDIQRALTWQLRQYVPTTEADPLRLPPVFAGQDTQLRVWLGHNRKQVVTTLQPTPQLRTNEQAQQARAVLDRIAVPNASQRQGAQPSTSSQTSGSPLAASTRNNAPTRGL